MQTVKERIAYLRGLLDGSDSLQTELSKSVMEKLLDILDSLADEVDDLALEQQDLAEYLEAVDSDLGDLEDDLDDLDDLDEFDEPEGEMIQMDCPSCGETVVFEEDFVHDDNVTVNCPQCGSVVFDSGEWDDVDLDVDDDEDEDEDEDEDNDNGSVPF